MTVYEVPDGPKMLRETLCLAQSEIGNSPWNEDRKQEHIDRLQRMINATDAIRDGAQCPYCTSPYRDRRFVMPTTGGVAPCGHAWHGGQETGAPVPQPPATLDNARQRAAIHAGTLFTITELLDQYQGADALREAVRAAVERGRQHIAELDAPEPSARPTHHERNPSVTDHQQTADLAVIDQKLAELTGELLTVAARYDGVDFAEAAQKLSASLATGKTTRDGMCTAVATLALRLQRERVGTGAAIRVITESDRKLNVTGRLHAILSNYGGQYIIAGPAMEKLVDELSAEADALGREGYLPAAGTTP